MTIGVDFGQLVGVSGIATQGCSYGRVTRYRMRYGYDGEKWYGYPHKWTLTVRLLYRFYICTFTFVLSL